MAGSVIDRTRLKLRYRNTIVIYISLVASVLAYALVVFVVTHSQSPRPPAPRVGMSIYGAVLLLGLGIILGRRVLFNPSRLMRIVEEGGLNRLIDELANKTILLGALSEAIALLGLALSLLSQSPDHMWRLGAIAILLLLRNVPRRSAWERALENFSRVTYEE